MRFRRRCRCARHAIGTEVKVRGVHPAFRQSFWVRKFSLIRLLGDGRHIAAAGSSVGSAHRTPAVPGDPPRQSANLTEIQVTNRAKLATLAASLVAGKTLINEYHLLYNLFHVKCYKRFLCWRDLQTCQLEFCDLISCNRLIRFELFPFLN
jgi:hypothetical protein